MDDLFGLIVIIIGIAAGIYSDKKKKEGKQKKAAVPNQPGGGRKNVPQTQVSYGGHAGRPDVLADFMAHICKETALCIHCGN